MIDRKQHIKEGKRQLNSCAHYIQIENEVTNNVSKLVHDTLIQLWRKGELNDKTLEYLSPIGDKKKRKQQSYIYSKKFTLTHQQRPGQLSQLITAQLKIYLNMFISFYNHWLLNNIHISRTYLISSGKLRK